MKHSKMMLIIFIIITFIFGLYATVSYKSECKCNNNKGCKCNCNCKRDCDCNCNKRTENFENKSCPDMLIKKGNSLILYNSNEELGPNNPIPFFNLDEYINYLEVQKSKGVDCPVLFLQQENNAQGENVYRIRPGPFDMQGGLPSTPNDESHVNKQIKKAIEVLDGHRDSKIYNKDQYSGFDAHGQHVGEYTNLDAIHDSTSSKKISDNPMDKNWAGTTYTQQMVDSGKYVGNEITKPYFFNPKTVFFPSIPSNVPTPKDIL